MGTTINFNIYLNSEDLKPFLDIEDIVREKVKILIKNEIEEYKKKIEVK